MHHDNREKANNKTELQQKCVFKTKFYCTEMIMLNVTTHTSEVSNHGTLVDIH